MATPLTAPVLLIAANCLSSTLLVFDSVKNARPRKLYLALNGPPPGDEKSKRIHAEITQLFAAVDWPCEVNTRSNPIHMGRREAVVSAIDWFFTCEPEGIILEDDCLPSADFFLFCEVLLQKYRDDVRVYHISGSNLQFGVKRGYASYYFGQIPAVWGWAGWRRVWKKFSLDMTGFPEFVGSRMLERVLPDKMLARRLELLLQASHDRSVQTWNLQYGYNVVVNNGLCLHPNVNLVSYLGNHSGEDQSSAGISAIVAIPCLPIGFPLIHPKIFVADLRADLLQSSWTPQDERRDIPRRMLANSQFIFTNEELSKSHEHR